MTHNRSGSDFDPCHIHRSQEKLNRFPGIRILTKEPVTPLIISKPDPNSEIPMILVSKPHK